MFGVEMFRVFEDMYYEAGWVGYAVGLSHQGQRSASKDVSVTTDYTDQVPWGGWKPGDVDAAKQLIGDVNAPGLQNLLDNRYITIQGIERTRYTELANILARGVERGDSIATVSTAIDRWLENLPNDPDNPTPQELVRLGTSNPWNEMVARTEVRSATTAASLDSYREGGLEYVQWLTADGGCEICAEYEDMGSVALDEGFGDIDGPPAHPNCLCVILPVVGQVVEEEPLLELSDDELAEVFGGIDSIEELPSEEDPNADKPGYIAITDEMYDWEKELIQQSNNEAPTAEQVAEQQKQKIEEETYQAQYALGKNYNDEYFALDPDDQLLMQHYVASLQEGASTFHDKQMDYMEKAEMKALYDSWQKQVEPKWNYVPTDNPEQVKQFCNVLHEANYDWMKKVDARMEARSIGGGIFRTVIDDIESYSSINEQRYLDKPRVQEVLSNAPRYDMPVYRGMNLSGESEEKMRDRADFARLSEGDLMPSKYNNASFSSEESVALEFAGVEDTFQDNWKNSVMIYMDGIHGIPVEAVTEVPNEHEYITNSLFRVTKKEVNEDGQMFLWVTEERKR